MKDSELLITSVVSLMIAIAVAVRDFRENVAWYYLRLGAGSFEASYL
jgi:hypothetical protein